MCYRRGWITILLANLVACGCNYSKGQDHVATATSADETRPLKVIDNKPPRLVADKTSYDFEKMDQQQAGSYIFEIRNEGPGDLLLRIQHTSCGCTSVKLGEVEWDPKNPAPKTIVTVPQGGTIDVEMNWNTQERVGDFKTSANIESNDPKLPVSVFSVHGEITPYIQVTQNPVKMEEVRNGEVTTASTYVFSQKFDDLELTDVSSSNPLVTAEFEPANQLFLDSMSATSAVKVTISIQPGLPIGPFATSLTFKTNKEERPDFTINVVGHVLGAVLLSPEEHLDFGIVKVNEVQAKTIFVKIVGDSAVEVQKGKVNLYRSDASGKATGTPIDSSFLNVSLTKFEGRKNFWRLKVQIPQGSPGGKFKGVIELDTTHPTAKVVKIPVRFEISK